MDRNTIIGFILIAIIVVGYSIWSAPSKEELAKQKREQDSIALVQKQTIITDSIQKTQTAPEAAKATQSATTTDLKLMQRVFPDSNLAEQQFNISNELMTVTLSNRGGKVISVELKKYKTYDQKPLVLFTP